MGLSSGFESSRISHKRNFFALAFILGGIVISGAVIAIMILKRRSLMIKDTTEAVVRASIMVI